MLGERTYLLESMKREPNRKQEEMNEQKGWKEDVIDNMERGPNREHGERT